MFSCRTFGPVFARPTTVLSFNAMSSKRQTLHAYWSSSKKMQKTGREFVAESERTPLPPSTSGLGASPSMSNPGECVSLNGPKLASLITEVSWQQLLQQESSKQYWKCLEAFVQSEWSTKRVFPGQGNTFRAFNSVPLHKVRVVILGQDPYHGVGQAEGWAFSVPKGQQVPSSLQNIYKELASDLGCTIPSHGHLADWVGQGVLLLNTSLTVEEHKANSHANKGWETFTNAVIQYVSDHCKGVVFMLWGKHAQKRKDKVDFNKHMVLECAHPSGLSAHRGFFGCKHFSKCNDALRRAGCTEIEWQIR